jgi:hypothetical protein
MFRWLWIVMSVTVSLAMLAAIRERKLLQHLSLTQLGQQQFIA